MKIGIWSAQTISGGQYSVIAPTPGDADVVYDRIGRAVKKTFPDEKLDTLVWERNAWSSISLRRVVVRKLAAEQT